MSGQVTWRLSSLGPILAYERSPRISRATHQIPLPLNDSTYAVGALAYGSVVLFLSCYLKFWPAGPKFQITFNDQVPCCRRPGILWVCREARPLCNSRE